MDLVKEWSQRIVKQTSENLSLPEDIVLAVYKDQWRRAKLATKDCNQIEFSGLGKFTMKLPKVKKQLEKFITLYDIWLKKKEIETDPLKLHALETKLTQMARQ